MHFYTEMGPAYTGKLLDAIEREIEVNEKVHKTIKWADLSLYKFSELHEHQEAMEAIEQTATPDHFDQLYRLKRKLIDMKNSLHAHVATE